jgi:hypothetical protein
LSKGIRQEKAGLKFQKHRAIKGDLMSKQTSPQKTKSTSIEDSLKTVGECKNLAKDRADWNAKQHSSPVLRYYEHVSWAFDNARILTGMAIAKVQYLYNSDVRKQFFIRYGHLHENLQRARELRGPEPKIEKGKILNLQYNEFLSAWPRNPGITLGFSIVENSALEAAYCLVGRIEGAILSAQDKTGQGDKFDSISIDDTRVGSWLTGLFTDQIRRLLGLSDSIQILRGNADRYRDEKLNLDAGVLRSKLDAEKEDFVKAKPDVDEYVTIVEFMKRHCIEYKGIDYIGRKEAIYEAEKKGIIKLPKSVNPRIERKARKFAASSLRFAWGEIQKHVHVPPLKA